jgi:hypothetical protein
MTCEKHGNIYVGQCGLCLMESEIPGETVKTECTTSDAFVREMKESIRADYKKYGIPILPRELKEILDGLEKAYYYGKKKENI